MKTVYAVAGLLAAVASAADQPARIEARASGTSSSPLPTITVKGKAFMNGDQRFYIRGVDYQPGGSSNLVDPLADTSICNRDIAVFKKLGLNTVRVYTVDNTLNHDACMQALADAGIYLALDVNTPNYSINREKPAPSYNAAYLQNIFATIDAFAGYSNLLLFFSGNEVLNTVDNTPAAPYVKAVTRDMKQYIGERGYRAIPVGYSAADVPHQQYPMGQYMACGETPSQSDFYSINNYEWCSPSSFTESGWDQLVELYDNYSQPLFFSEYGCIKPMRDFSETPALYQTDMTTVVSGGLVYQYNQDSNNYGLVTINGDTVTPVGQQVDLLSAALTSTSDPSGNGNLSTAGITQPCPDGTTFNISPFSGSALPALPSDAQKYYSDGAGKGPGFAGPGSQNSGDGNVATASANAGAVMTTLGTGPTGTGPSASHSSGAASALRPAGSGQMGAWLGCGFVAMLGMGLGAFVL